jgi:hypothetical protein
MQVSASPDVVTKPGTVVSRAVLSSTTLADSDGDGIGDSQERDRKLDPTNVDTDGDGIRDDVELAGFDANCFGEKQKIFTDPLDADSDDDGVPDGSEKAGWVVRVPSKVAYRVTSCPLDPDPDLDGLPDGLEFERKTDPTLFDTDADNLNDRSEFLLGLSPLDGAADCVRIRYASISMSGNCGPGDATTSANFRGTVQLQRSRSTGIVSRDFNLLAYGGDNTTDDGKPLQQVDGSGNVTSLIKADYVMKPGDKILLRGHGLIECDGDNCLLGDGTAEFDFPNTDFAAPLSDTSQTLSTTQINGFGAGCTMNLQLVITKLTDTSLSTLPFVQCIP